MLYVDAVAADPNQPDIEAQGLLDDLQGRVRQERAELIGSLLARGFDVEQFQLNAA
jgi:adenylate cyclase